MQTGSPPAGDLDLRNYLRVPRRRWKVIAFFGLLVPTVAVLISLRQLPRYAASSEVLVKRQDLAASLTSGQLPYTDAQTAARVIETQAQLARVPDLADDVIAAADLVGRETATGFLSSSSVSVKPNSDILVFTVERSSPSEARALSAFYADQFTMYRRQLDTTELDALATSVRSQLASIDSADPAATPLRDELQGKLRQIQTLQALQTSSAVVVRRPDAATRVGPTPITMGLGGLVLGLMLGGGLVFLLESLDTRVRRASEVGAVLGIPLLARLPGSPARSRKNSGLVMVEEPDSVPAEAFSFLRTNLTFATTASDAKVIMFCSAVEQEGKSTTIANLGVAIARTGGRVTLVDLDNRRPTLHSFFAIARSPGISDVCRGAIDLDQALRDVPVPPRKAPAGAPAQGTDQASLRVLPAGGVSHALDVDDVVSVIDRLRDDADVVLVDTPPLLLVGETLALGARMDALVVVARLNHVHKPMLEELRRAVDGAPVRAMGFVVTAAAEEPGYSRYYGHAYGQSPEDEDRPAPGGPDTSPPAEPAPAAEPNGRSRLSAPPDRAPEPTSAEPSARDALVEAVFPTRSHSANGQPGSDTRPVGVQPRRSWAEGGRRVPSLPSPGLVDQTEPSDGTPPSSSRNGTKKAGKKRKKK